MGDVGTHTLTHTPKHAFIHTLIRNYMHTFIYYLYIRPNIRSNAPPYIRARGEQQRLLCHNELAGYYWCASLVAQNLSAVGASWVDAVANRAVSLLKPALCSWSARNRRPNRSLLGREVEGSKTRHCLPTHCDCATHFVVGLSRWGSSRCRFVGDGNRHVTYSQGEDAPVE